MHKQTVFFLLCVKAGTGASSGAGRGGAEGGNVALSAERKGAARAHLASRGVEWRDVVRCGVWWWWCGH